MKPGICAPQPMPHQLSHKHFCAADGLSPAPPPPSVMQRPPRRRLHTNRHLRSNAHAAPRTKPQQQPHITSREFQGFSRVLFYRRQAAQGARIYPPHSTLRPGHTQCTNVHTKCACISDNPSPQQVTRNSVGEIGKTRKGRPISGARKKGSAANQRRLAVTARLTNNGRTVARRLGCVGSSTAKRHVRGHPQRKVLVTPAPSCPPLGNLCHCRG